MHRRPGLGLQMKPSSFTSTSGFHPYAKGSPSTSLSKSRVLSESFSMNQSSLMGDTNDQRLEAYGSLLPVLVIEAISTEAVSVGSLSVKIGEEGWAWLVCGRRLFVWKYKKSSATRAGSCSCYELQLPPSDLAHKSDLVSVVLPQTGHTHVVPAVIAVSPEGIVRYWPNIAYEGHSLETTAADLQGQECYSLTNIQPLGYILGTTTSSLVHIVINNTDSGNVISCRTLKVPQGMLAGISRRVTSFIFGPMPAAQSSETKPLIRIFKQPSSAENSDTLVYVLAGCLLQKWQMISPFSERLVFDCDLDRAFRDAFVEAVWNKDTTHPNQLQVWPLDIAVWRPNELVLLVAGINVDISNQLHYALAFLDTKKSDLSAVSGSVGGAPSGPVGFTSFTVLRNHAACYSSESEANLLNLKLLTGVAKSRFLYIYDETKVLCLSHGNDVVVDVIDFDRRDDGILGAGVCDGVPLLFTFKDALVSIITHFDDSSAHEVDVPWIEVEMVGGDDKSLILKKAFHLYLKKDVPKSLSLLSATFPSAPGILSDPILSEAVVGLSNELCDETPSSDPRWAESGSLSSTTPTTASVIIVKQLEEKLTSHRLLIDFLHHSGLWERLGPVTLRGSLVSSQLVLYEHSEKIVAAIALKNLPSDYGPVVDSAIRSVLRKREVTVPKRLTPHDIYYREVTKLFELIPLLIDYQEEQISNSLSTAKDNFSLVVSCANIMNTIFQDVARFRQNAATFYGQLGGHLEEWVPWDASTSSGSGNQGIRSALMRQFELLLNFGIGSKSSAYSASVEESIQIKSKVYQKVAELVDIILGGYVHQLKLVKKESEHYKEIKRQFESERSKRLEPLLKAKQFERATALAEKYLDFDILIRICEEEDERKERLDRYATEFANEGFADFLFKWYLKEGKQGKMLTTSAGAQSLGGFLEDHESLRWLHQIHQDQFKGAADTLETLGRKEQDFLFKKKTLLSLSKLAALAGGETETHRINSQLDLIRYQETLPEALLLARDLDPGTMRPLNPRELIELYISDENLEANEEDFKKALDLTHALEEPMPVKNSSDSISPSKVRLGIFATAILRDRDSWTDFAEEDPLAFIRQTLFFRVINLAFIQGEDLNDFLPTCEQLMLSQELQRMAQNSTFSYLIKAAYEHVTSYNLMEC